MVQTTLLVAGLVSIASATVYAFVGAKLRQRDVPGEARLAARAFAVWWISLATVTLVGGATRVLGAAGSLPLWVLLVTTYGGLAVLCVALWGLLYYLVYLYTGSQRAVYPVTLFYVGYYLALVWLITASQPIGVAVERWSVALAYADEPGGPLVAVIVLLLVVPQILAAAAYFTLFFRVRGRTQRYRVGLVAATVVVWFSSALVGWLWGVSGSDGWQFFSRGLGVVSSLAILAAYLPPPWVRRRFGVRSLDEERAARPDRSLVPERA